MENKNMPAIPTPKGLLDELTHQDILESLGLTKMEHFAATLPRMEFSASPETIEAVLGRKVDWDDAVDGMKAAAEIEAKFRVIRAEALLAELEKNK